jgi:hypothetical protein
MASSPPLSSPWCPLPLCPTPATPEPPSSRLPQLRRPHRRGEERRRPQSSVSPWSDPLCSIQIERPRPPVTLRAFNPPGLIPSVRFRSNGPDREYRFAHVCPDALTRLSAPKSSGAGPARSVRPSPSAADAPGPACQPRLRAHTRARARAI